MKSAQQGAANWQASAGRAATAYQQGVEGYSGDWAGATVNQEAALLTNFQQAIARGDWRNGVLSKGTAGWKGDTVAKIGNFSTGFQAGAQRQAAAMQKIVAAEQNIVPGLPSRGTYEQNMTRQRAFSDAMHALKGQLGAT